MRHPTPVVMWMCLAIATVVGSTAPGCAATKADVVLVSGQTVDTLGDQFIITAQLMKAGHDAGTVDDDTYHSWQVFGEKFKATYHLAVQLWIAAADTRDAGMVAQVGSIIAQLGSELGQFTAKIRGSP